MKDKTTHTKNTGNENADNMTQPEETNEVLTNEQNAEQVMGHENVPMETDDELAKKLQSELDELKDKHIRLIAEFDNFRRRNAKERVELSQTAGKEMIQSLLVVLDDVDRAAKVMENSTDVSVIKEGISLVFNKLRAIMQQKGLKAMDAANTEFDPDLHEAITEVPAPHKNMVGKVMDVVEQGYYLNDKLIRHAKVVVGK